ncbi:MAG: hypothetical protein KDN18_02755, partial [Verrucomicrobiae bacterium]|nr:hypothetical protein [Verrucomicrobiae bacterium]
PTPPAPPAPNYLDMIPDDHFLDDWIRDLEERYSGPGEVNIYYEGFNQYGPDGEPISSFNSAPGLD